MTRSGYRPATTGVGRGRRYTRHVDAPRQDAANARDERPVVARSSLHPHDPVAYTAHWEAVASVVRYGSSVADESELRLCGDVTGKRIIELGISAPSNAVALASAGARALAVDPSADRITLLRRQAEAAEVTVQCHQSDVADLGFATSGSVDLVVASHTLADVDDLSRLLRQIHRVLKPDAAFIMAEQHPIAAMLTASNAQQSGPQTGSQAGQPGQVVQRPYGSPARSISDVFMAMQRTNFRIDVMHELMPINNRSALAPLVLVIRARKLGV